MAATLASAGASDIFVAKYDRNGLLVWATRAGGTLGDDAGGIAIDSAGGIYVAGRFAGTATFGGGELRETTLTSAGGSDIFLAKYHPNGFLTWVTRAGGAAGDAGQDLATDQAGGIYVTGHFVGAATFGEGEAGETTLTAAHGTLFVARYAMDGSLVWVTSARREGSFFSGAGLAADSAGNTYVTGAFEGTIVFGEGETGETTLVNPPGAPSKSFLAKYGPDGSLSWAVDVSVSGLLGGRDDFPRGVATDHAGNVYVTGGFWISSAAGVRSDIMLLKFDPGGELLWLVSAGGGRVDAGHGITTDRAGNIFLTGFYSDDSTFGRGEVNETILSTLSDVDVFVAKYDRYGFLVWADGSHGNGRTVGMDLAMDGFGNVYVTGHFAGTTTFGSDQQGETTLTSRGFDVFTARFVASPEEQVEALISFFRELLSESRFPAGVAHALITKLRQALASSQSGQGNAACGQLRAFDRQLAAVVKLSGVGPGKWIEPAAAVNSIGQDWDCRQARY